MAETAVNEPVGEQPGGQKIICTKCGESNPGDGRRCIKCNSRLYRRCPLCSARNPRKSKICGSCGGSMERSGFSHLRHQLKTKRVRRFIRTSKFVLSLLVLLALIGLGLYFLSSN